MPGKIDLWSMSDLTTPWTIRVVATLRIAEHVKAGVTQIDKLAEVAGCDRDTLDRVLGHLVEQGVFEEPRPGTLELNDAAAQLLESPLQLGLDLDGFGGRMAGAWNGLLSTVRTGTCAYSDVFGLPFWEDLDAHPAIGASFDNLMGPGGHGAPSPQVLIEDDWDSVHVVADIGGGSGSLLAAVLSEHSDLRGVLVDLPRAVAASATTFAEAGVSDRVTTVGQSFFEALPSADLYLLKSILADWPDAEAATILRRCGEAARENGARIVVLGSVSAPGEEKGEADLLMLVLLGGKQRTLEEFEQLAADAGLSVSASGQLPSGGFAVECRPA
jgi:2,7-dihydroxy-5-methyl-1-naphthoate 7-O-methyltransferase